MKKFLTTAIALCLSLVLAACAGGNAARQGELTAAEPAGPASDARTTSFVFRGGFDDVEPTFLGVSSHNFEDEDDIDPNYLFGNYTTTWSGMGNNPADWAYAFYTFDIGSNAAETVQLTWSINGGVPDPSCLVEVWAFDMSGGRPSKTLLICDDHDGNVWTYQLDGGDLEDFRDGNDDLTISVLLKATAADQPSGILAFIEIL